LYSTTAIFDPEEDKGPRRIPPTRDHGFDLTAWPKQPRTKSTTEIPHRTMARDIKNRDYDMISGVPFENSFKSSLQQILATREQSQQFNQRRTISPISNTFPTKALEDTRAEAEALARQKVIERRLSGMPENERRARTGALNIIDGRCTDETAARVINDYPGSHPERSVKALQQEEKIIQERDRVHAQEVSRVSCRYNNGRAKELRDLNIINGGNWNAELSEDVRDKPSVWQWCSTERLDTSEV
jgi:hypothetical protein